MERALGYEPRDLGSIPSICIVNNKNKRTEKENKNGKKLGKS